jgi:hypothetical protein
MWRSSVELVDTTLNDMNTPNTMTATVSSTQESASHEQNAATPSIVGARTDNSSNMGSTTNNSPLTMLEFSDIEMEGECERDTRKRGGRNVFMAENGYAVGTDDEENAEATTQKSSRDRPNGFTRTPQDSQRRCGAALLSLLTLHSMT